ncbi:hypothetical protein LINGRAHAP2_LOCUS17299 [Linum grandiflorum]
MIAAVLVSLRVCSGRCPNLFMRYIMI